MPLENAQSLLNISQSEHTINLVNGFDVSFTAYWLCRAPCANQDLYLSLESLRSGVNFNTARILRGVKFSLFLAVFCRVEIESRTKAGG